MPPRRRLSLLCGLAAGSADFDEACCAYPEHDPRDHSYPYSHLQYAEVVPDVVGPFVPMTELGLTYGAGPAAREVRFGKPIAPALVERAPTVRFALGSHSRPGTLHTLIAVDPVQPARPPLPRPPALQPPSPPGAQDVPFRDAPSEAERLLWLVYDIPANETARGKTLVRYEGARPQPCPAADRLCLAEHRVTFVLWEQPHGRLSLHAEDSRLAAGASSGASHGAPADARKRYRARDFASRHRLGLPIACNFFETWHPGGGGSGGTRIGEWPWWHVRDGEPEGAPEAGGGKEEL